MDQITVVPEKELTGIDIGHHGICMDLYVEECEDRRLVKVYGRSKSLSKRKHLILSNYKFIFKMKDKTYDIKKLPFSRLRHM